MRLLAVRSQRATRHLEYAIHALSPLLFHSDLFFLLQNPFDLSCSVRAVNWNFVSRVKSSLAFFLLGAQLEASGSLSFSSGLLSGLSANLNGSFAVDPVRERREAKRRSAYSSIRISFRFFANRMRFRLSVWAPFRSITLWSACSIQTSLERDNRAVCSRKSLSVSLPHTLFFDAKIIFFCFSSSSQNFYSDQTGSGYDSDVYLTGPSVLLGTSSSSNKGLKIGMLLFSCSL